MWVNKSIISNSTTYKSHSLDAKESEAVRVLFLGGITISEYREIKELDDENLVFQQGVHPLVIGA